MAGQQRITGIFPQLGPLGKDCHNTTNAACDIPAKNGCETRYYPDGCNTKVAPSWANAITSEIANVIKEGGTEYDCSRLDNLANGVQGMINNNLFGCLTNNFDTVKNSCSIKYLVLSESYNEEGKACQKISIYDKNDASITVGSEASSERIPSGYNGVFPIDPIIYDARSLYEDQANNSIDTEKLRKSHFTTLNFDLPCAAKILIETTVVVDMGSTDIVNGVSYMIDGKFLFNPSYPEGERNIHKENFSKYEAKPTVCLQTTLSPGHHTIKLYLLSGTKMTVDRRYNDTINLSNTTVSLAL